MTTWDAKVIAQSLRQIDMDLSLRIFQTIKYDSYYHLLNHHRYDSSFIGYLFNLLNRICNFLSRRKSNILVRHVVVVGM